MSAAIGDRREQRGNIARLTLAQALAGANSAVIYAVGAIVGAALAPDKALALAVVALGLAATLRPASPYARPGQSDASSQV